MQIWASRVKRKRHQLCVGYVQLWIRSAKPSGEQDLKQQQQYHNTVMSLVQSCWFWHSEPLRRGVEWLDDLGFKVLSTIFKSYQADGRLILKSCMQIPLPAGFKPGNLLSSDWATWTPERGEGKEWLLRLFGTYTSYINSSFINWTSLCIIACHRSNIV